MRGAQAPPAFIIRCRPRVDRIGGVRGVSHPLRDVARRTRVVQEAQSVVSIGQVAAGEVPDRRRAGVLDGVAAGRRGHHREDERSSPDGVPPVPPILMHPAIQAAGHRASHDTATTTLPSAWPAPTWASACGVSSSPNVRSMWIARSPA